MFATDNRRSGWVAGVDACRAGWLVVLRDASVGASRIQVASNFSTVLALSEAPQVIAIDVPIGLLAFGRDRGRECEALARRCLGKRSPSVFSAPSRAALAAFRAGKLYPEVSAANGGAWGGPGISQQAFGILQKISEVDAQMTPELQAVVHEIHPELCFAVANGGEAMVHKKKSAEGRAERLSVLAGLGFGTFLENLVRPKGAQWDDVLDACVACWTATRIADGTAVVTPPQPAIDARGLRMELWA
ncbi:MAG: DUF429 domain-containing protein [Bauldia sp.]